MTIKKKIRNFIRRAHLAFDGWVGRIFSKQGRFEELASKSHNPLKMDNMAEYSYSKKWHFPQFHILPIHKNQSPATCDLKVYQDSFAYTFIRDNLWEGARILEIGGGESRTIKEIRGKYDIWNLDKLEGSGFGPTDLLDDEGFHLVKDYIGSFSRLLPEASFDLIYSISTMEHFPKDEQTVQNIINDMDRLLKPGGFCLHSVDALLFEDHFFVHPLVKKIFDAGLTTYPLPSFEQLASDISLWTLPPYAFYTRWYHLVKQPLKEFGLPFSINLVWQK